MAEAVIILSIDVPLSFVSLRGDGSVDDGIVDLVKSLLADPDILLLPSLLLTTFLFKIGIESSANAVNKRERIRKNKGEWVRKRERERSFVRSRERKKDQIHLLLLPPALY